MEKDGRLPPQSNGGRSYRRQKNLSNPEPNLRIFIAGATGVVGRRAVPLLVAAGHRVTAVARTPEKRAELERMGAAAVYVDLFASDSVRGAVARHDIVINLATSIPPSSHAFLPGAWRKNDRVRSRHARSAPAEVPPGVGANADRLVGRNDRTVAAHFQPEVAPSQWVVTPISERAGRVARDHRVDRQAGERTAAPLKSNAPEQHGVHRNNHRRQAHQQCTGGG